MGFQVVKQKEIPANKSCAFITGYVRNIPGRRTYQEASCATQEEKRVTRRPAFSGKVLYFSFVAVHTIEIVQCT